MKIAPGFKACEWWALNLDGQGSDWNRAIDVFEKRIRSRYLDPVDLLVQQDETRAPKERRFGFTLLAIDCLLVETLRAFVEGKENTNKQSRPVFKRFLTQATLFKPYFDDARATRFYEDFRCGILHQAEIRGDSRLWSVGPLVKVEGSQMTINRSEFHSRLTKEFEAYVTDLRSGANAQLRTHFAKR